MKPFYLIIMMLILTGAVTAQNQPVITGKNKTLERPVPYPIIPTKQFEKAIQKGTRNLSGKPGENYWTNFAEYKMKAVVSPASQSLSGFAEVKYFNNSPDTLSQVVLQLRQNMYKPEAIRNIDVKPTNGMEIISVEVEGVPLVELSRRIGVGYQISGTLMYINMPKKLNSKSSMKFTFTWKYKLPTGEDGRQGHDDNVFFAGYWYPQFSVYDDLNGWDKNEYLGNAEFYMGYADYDVEITAPEGYLIGSTGMLENPKEVLCDSVLVRLEKTEKSNKVVHIVRKEERAAKTSTRSSKNGVLTWNFKAENVRDFAFAFSSDFIWDAVSTRSKDNPVMIHSFYRPSAKFWEKSAEYGKFSVETLSSKIMEYPWPQMTCVEGVIYGGMEFPMITLIGGVRSDYSLFGVVYHEIAHMWFPMIVGSNENNYSWMDEGLTNFNENEGVDVWKPDTLVWKPSPYSGYYRIAAAGNEIEPMRFGDEFPVYGGSFNVATYEKPQITLQALRGILGNEQFYKAFREYAKRWAFKHPQPYDLFNTFKNITGTDFDWLFRSMLFETWTLDQSISKVSAEGNTTVISVDDLGLMPLPVLLKITHSNGETEKVIIPVDVWLEGKKSASVTVDKTDIQKVEIDADMYFPDVNRKNNVWEKR